MPYFYYTLLVAVLAASLQTTPKPPSIDVSNVATSRIEDNVAAAFTVSRIRLEPASIGNGKTAAIDSVHITVVKSDLRDSGGELVYTAFLTHVEIDSTGDYAATFKLAGRIPLNRGKVSGTVNLKVGARSVVDGRYSEMAYQACTVSVRN